MHFTLEFVYVILAAVAVCTVLGLASWSCSIILASREKLHPAVFDLLFRTVPTILLLIAISIAVTAILVVSILEAIDG